LDLNFEITSSALVLHFFDEKTVIPLAEIKSYQVRWYLHDPIFGKKWWFLVLTVVLENGHEESAPVTFVKFNYLMTRSNRGGRSNASSLTLSILR
jgi:hypothetical protein